MYSDRHEILGEDKIQAPKIKEINYDLPAKKRTKEKAQTDLSSSSSKEGELFVLGWYLRR